MEVATKRPPHQSKNTGVVLVPYWWMEVHPYSYFWWCGYFWGPWVSFVTTDEFSLRVTQIISRICVSWAHSLPFYIWTYFNSMNYGRILWKECKPDNYESPNSLKLSLTNIRDLLRILLIVNLSLSQTLLTFFLYVRQTWLA